MLECMHFLELYAELLKIFDCEWRRCGELDLTLFRWFHVMTAPLYDLQ